MSLYLAEHKHASQDITPGGDYWKRVVAMDQQVSTYVAGMRSVGYEVVGVLYDVLRKPDFRPKLATPPDKREYKKNGELYASQRLQDEDPTEFCRRVLAEIAEDFPRYYQRGRVVRLTHDLLEGAHDAWQTGLSIREARHSGMFPRNPDSCQTYGRTCEYLPICAGEAEASDPLLYRIGTERHEELDAANRDPRVVLSQSAMRTFRACPRRYQLQYEKRIRSRKLAEPLRRGRNLHGALNEWWRSGGDLEKALAALDDTDKFKRALEGAMICGYHARWERPPGRVVAVEQEFVCDLVNPSSGAKSRTFAIAGKVDAIVELEAGQTGVTLDRSMERALEKIVEVRA